MEQYRDNPVLCQANSNETSHFLREIPHPALSENDNNGKLKHAVVLAELEQQDKQALVARFAQVKDVPFDRNDLPPVLDKFLAIIKDGDEPLTDAKEQSLVTALLPAMAANIGNKVYMVNHGVNHYCNVWSIVIAPSTLGRKTTSLNLATEPLQEYGETLKQEYEYKRTTQGPNDPDPKLQMIMFPRVTPEAFVQLLQDNPNGILEYSEITSFLAGLNKSYNGDLKSFMTEAFDTRRQTKFMTKKDGVIYVRRPCFSIAAATTKSWLLKELDSNDMTSGFMQRFLVCDSNDINLDDLDLSAIEGVTQGKALHNFLARLYKELRSVGTIENPVKLSLSEDALALYGNVIRDITNKARDANNDNLLSFYGRIYPGYFHRFCILFHLSEMALQATKEGSDIQSVMNQYGSYAYQVSEETAEYALNLCAFYMANITAFLKNEIGRDDYTEKERKVVKLFQGARTRILPHSHCLRMLNLSAKQFNDLMIGLSGKEVVRTCTITTEAGRKAKAYEYLLFDDDPACTLN